MIGIIIVAIFVGYIILSIAVISVVYKKTKNIKKMFIALAIMILIPTWDVIIGYPIYKFLCWSNAGVHIYKTVDNVEGFYVGKRDIHTEPHEPYKNYKYIDYKEMNYSKPTGKYYRSYWLDNNTSEECVPIGDDAWTNNGELYSKHFKQGKCIVKEEIAESEVSRWEFAGYKIGSETEIPILNINRVISFKFFDKKSNATLGELVEYSWGVGWVRNLLGYFIGGSGFGCSGIGKTSNYDHLYIKILKPKERGEN